MSLTISILGKVTNLEAADAQRLTAYVVVCDNVLARGPLQADGSFRVNLPRSAVSAKSAYGLTLSIAPAAANEHVPHLDGAVQTNLRREELLESQKEYRVADISIGEETLKRLLILCPFYCISGAVVGTDQCGAPGAQVTVYSVAHSGSGYSKTARATVTTAPDGTFTACFPWCSCRFCLPCWPCFPIWWECWPWWWEFDILSVLESLEPRLASNRLAANTFSGKVSLIRPEAKALAVGQGFPSSRAGEFAPDAQRTALIRNKLANLDLREIFPWWWWCCEDPNIVFSVTQNGSTILDEDPATATRWCLADGSSVTLVGNSQTDTICNPGCPPETGFVWTNVGGLIDVANIDQSTGYAELPGDAGTDYQDMAFQGGLNLYGQYAPGAFSYYQVYTASWGGNPLRGGVKPPAGTGSPVAASLTRYLYVYDSLGNYVASYPVQLGPFNQGGLVNLYATIEARQSQPAPPGLAPFPAIPPGGSYYWGDPGLLLSASSSVLTSGVDMTGVDLALVPYQADLTSVDLTPNNPLTLTIDNTPLTTADVVGITAFTAGGMIPVESGDCPAYDIGPGGYIQIKVNVSDANGHLFKYYLDAEYGHGTSGAVTPPGVRGYKSNPLTSGLDPDYTKNSWIGGPETMTYTPPVDCCYEFRIYAGKRVTDGNTFPGLSALDFQTINLKVSS